MRAAFVVAGLAAVAYAETKTVTATVDQTITSCAPTVTNCPYKSIKTSSVDADPSHTWADWESEDPAATSTAAAEHTWVDWESSSAAASTTTKKAVDPVPTSTAVGETWGDWDSASIVTKTDSPVTASTSSSALCPSYTATGPPAWFSLLPSSVLSSVAAKWTGAPPADWCYYTYSTSSLATSTAAASATVSSAPYWPVKSSSSAPVAGVSSTGVVKPYASSTGPAVAAWTGAANVNAGSMALAGLAAAAALVMA